MSRPSGGLDVGGGGAVTASSGTGGARSISLMFWRFSCKAFLSMSGPLLVALPPSTLPFLLSLLPPASPSTFHRPPPPRSSTPAPVPPVQSYREAPATSWGQGGTCFSRLGRCRRPCDCSLNGCDAPLAASPPRQPRPRGGPDPVGALGAAAPTRPSRPPRSVPRVLFGARARGEGRGAGAAPRPATARDDFSRRGGPRSREVAFRPSRRRLHD